MCGIITKHPLYLLIYDKSQVKLKYKITSYPLPIYNGEMGIRCSTLFQMAGIGI
jgi:hypothetical protein